MAASLQKNDYILLAGDAAHIHSSGFAQGMNTGIHDATNLVWKLAGRVKGRYKPEVLQTYADERHAAAQKLIGIDMDAASLISGVIPPAYSSSGESAGAILSKLLREHMDFSAGLGVKYGPSVINENPRSTTLPIGTRAPDALVRGPGINVPIRLAEALLQQDRVSGRWSVLVFAGNHIQTADKVAALREPLAAEAKKRHEAIRFATITVSTVESAWMAFDGPAVGHLYFDMEGSAHAKYGVALDTGAIVVIRPDGLMGFAAGLTEVGEVTKFFGRIFI